MRALLCASALFASGAAADICQNQAITADPGWDPPDSWRVITGRAQLGTCTGGVRIWDTVDPFADTSAGHEQQACLLPDGNVSEFPLPPDFVITTQKFVGVNNQCIQGTGSSPVYDRMTIRIPSPTGSTTICDPLSSSNPDGESNVPSNFTVYAETPTFANNCTDPAVDFSIHVADPAGDVSCEYGQVPEGFVVTSRTPSPGACVAISGGVRELIRKPTPGQALAGVCTDAEAPIPEGFGYTNPGAASDCGPGGTDYDLVPAQHGAIFCSPQGRPQHLVINQISLALNGTCDTQYQYHLFDPLTNNNGNGSTTACKVDSNPLPLGFIVTNHVTNDAINCAPVNNRQTIRKPEADGGDVSCKDSPIPQGWVITNQTNAVSGTCTPTGKRWTLQRMDPEDTSAVICSFSPVPDGYFFQGPQTGGCDGQGTVSITSTPTAGARSCTTNLPAGYVVTSVELEPRCAGGLAYGYTQPEDDGSVTQACEPISLYPSNFVITSREASHSTCLGTPRMAILVPQLGTSETICSGSSIPGGWVVTSYAPEIGAPCAGEANVRTIENVEDAIGGGSTVSVCSGSPVPSDYVITDIAPGSSCWPSNVRWTIRRPNSQGVTTVCNGSPVPAGFTTIGSPGTGCNDAGTFQIQPTEPAPFIGVEPDVTSPPAAVPLQCPAPGTPGLLTGNATPNEAVCE